MRISDWSSDVCSSDLSRAPAPRRGLVAPPSGARLVLPGTGFQDCRTLLERLVREPDDRRRLRGQGHADDPPYAAIEPADLLAYVRLHAVDRVAPQVALLRVRRSEEHTSELQSLMRISYAVFC